MATSGRWRDILPPLTVAWYGIRNSIVCLPRTLLFTMVFYAFSQKKKSATLRTAALRALHADKQAPRAQLSRRHIALSAVALAWRHLLSATVARAQARMA